MVMNADDIILIHIKKKVFYDDYGFGRYVREGFKKKSWKFSLTRRIPPFGHLFMKRKKIL